MPSTSSSQLLLTCSKFQHCINSLDDWRTEDDLFKHEEFFDNMVFFRGWMGNGYSKMVKSVSYSLRLPVITNKHSSHVYGTLCSISDDEQGWEPLTTMQRGHHERRDRRLKLISCKVKDARCLVTLFSHTGEVCLRSPTVLVLPQAPSVRDSSIPQHGGHQQKRELSLRTHCTARSGWSQSAEKQHVFSNRDTGTSPQQSPGCHPGLSVTRNLIVLHPQVPGHCNPIMAMLTVINVTDWPQYHNSLSDPSTAHNKSQSLHHSKPSQHHSSRLCRLISLITSCMAISV